jgi:hypothetical protein
VADEVLMKACIGVVLGGNAPALFRCVVERGYSESLA